MTNWYPAKYSIGWYERKRIPSFAMWSVNVKQGNRYSKEPRYCGITETLEQAEQDLLYVLGELGLCKERCFEDTMQKISAVRSVIARKMVIKSK